MYIQLYVIICTFRSIVSSQFSDDSEGDVRAVSDHVHHLSVLVAHHTRSIHLQITKGATRVSLHLWKYFKTQIPINS